MTAVLRPAHFSCRLKENPRATGLHDVVKLRHSSVETCQATGTMPKGCMRRHLQFIKDFCRSKKGTLVVITGARGKPRTRLQRGYKVLLVLMLLNRAYLKVLDPYLHKPTDSSDASTREQRLSQSPELWVCLQKLTVIRIARIGNPQSSDACVVVRFLVTFLLSW